MKKTLGITLFLLGLTLNIQSQNLIPQSCYLRLVGSGDQESNIIMHLIKVNDSLYGDYNSTQIFGKINTAGNFWLKEWPGDQGVAFKGQFKDGQHISVTWTRPAGIGKKLSFDLVEKFPEGSIPFAVFYETDVKKITEDPKSPQSLLKLSLLVPDVTNDHPSIFDSVSHNILKNFSETSEYRIDHESAETTLKSMKKEFFKDYMSNNEAMYKEMPDASFGWELLKFTHIIYNEDYKLTYYILTYTYTGGAHGLEMQIFTTVDLKTGKPIMLNDLLKPGSENQLTILLTNKLHQMLKLPAREKLTESGYFVDEINPNDNFYLNGEGIGFFYNHYEIAPYSFGATDIFLTSEDLKGILK